MLSVDLFHAVPLKKLYLKESNAFSEILICLGRPPFEWNRRVFLQTPLLLKHLNPTLIICFIVVPRTSSQNPIVGLDIYRDRDFIGKCNFLIFFLQGNSCNRDIQFPPIFWSYQLIFLMQGESGHCEKVARELSGSTTFNPLQYFSIFLSRIVKFTLLLSV